jgi:hypothetical protein
MEDVSRRYYSSRTKPNRLSLEELYLKLQNLYLFFRDKDYFKQKAGITKHTLPEEIQHEASIYLSFQPFPITKWSKNDVTDDHIFDAIEFLYDRISKPGEMGDMTTETGWNYTDYVSYDDKSGKEEFREKVNVILDDYKNGFELTEAGIILAKGTDGLQFILDADIIPYDEVNVDCKVRDAITKWRNRHLSLPERKEAIRELADVFEWLQKTKKLENILSHKDESDLFKIANNFGIRHHNPSQKINYDLAIWYSWIFHFYLATYHAIIRLLIKNEKLD